MNPSHVDLLFAYALAAAAQEDPGFQELGPIHLLKYVYLGDLAYAEVHDGQTFTGAPWRFHHFGPWSPEVFQRLEPAMEKMGAVVRSFPSSFREEDAKRWRLTDPAELERLEGRVPGEAARSIRQAVRRFGSDTTSLLHYVYQTAPMLQAAPGEGLVFEARQTLPQQESAEVEPEALPKLSRTRLKKLQARVREMFREKKKNEAGVPDSPPRYDDVFEAGTRWLDGLAGEDLAPAQGQLRFSREVWKSRGRRAGDLP